MSTFLGRCSGRTRYEAYCWALGSCRGSLIIHPVETVSFDDISFYGSAARTGLNADYDADGIVDYKFDLPAYDIWVSGEEKDEDFINSMNRYEHLSI